MKEVIWYHADPKRLITDEKAVWNSKKIEAGNDYFVTECCPPGCFDSIEEYCYKTFVDMYYHAKALVYDDKMDALEDEDYDREPYTYKMYKVHLDFMENKNGVEYYEENRYPVKVYKYGGKLRCKYI